MDEVKELLRKDLYLFNKDIEHTDDGYYVVQLENYEEFNSTYLALEHNKDIERDSEHSFTHIDETHIQYEKEGFIIELIGLLDDDEYSLNIIKED